jgi:rhomboid protease GluP
MRLKLSRAPATVGLLVIIAIVFIFEMLSGASSDENKLIEMGATLPWVLEHRQYWRIFTSMFLHANLLHWAANSWALYQLGTLYEVMFGTPRFLFIYFVTGACASIASSMKLPPNGTSVGASGAVLGILGAFIFSIRRSPQWRHEPWTRGLLGQLVFWALLNVALGFKIKEIDNVAHIAGLVAGLLLGFLPHRVPPPPPSRGVIDVKPYEEGSLMPPQNQP